MKILVCTLLVVLNFLSISAEVKGVESQNSYQITKTYFDKNLKKGASSFVFTCANIDLLRGAAEIRMSDNSIEQVVKTNVKGVFKIKTKPGKHRFQFYISSQYYELVTDSIEVANRNVVHVTLFFQKSEERQMMKKPVIYLYPEKEMNVSVKLHVNGELKFTYPNYSEGWNLTVSPSGDLKVGGNAYPYLFWEGTSRFELTDIDRSHGYLIEGDSVVKFLEEKLTYMGLSDKERTDFITFWAPQMLTNSHVYIHFMLNEELNPYASLEISPKPTQFLRVFMLWAPCESHLVKSLQPQILPKLERKGFTVIEWGGTELHEMIKP